MKLIAIAAGCALTLTALSAHAQTPRFKPLLESEMSEAQRKAASEIASGPRGRLNPDGPNALLLRSPELMSRNQKVGTTSSVKNCMRPSASAMPPLKPCGINSASAA